MNIKVEKLEKKHEKTCQIYGEKLEKT